MFAQKAHSPWAAPFSWAARERGGAAHRRESSIDRGATIRAFNNMIIIIDQSTFDFEQGLTIALLDRLASDVYY